ncbi:MAG TPA: hypothetical protein VHF22_04090 [Planctomycetota bacterium]|nr:hypothetical protein [Planctomycetota bacterium]
MADPRTLEEANQILALARGDGKGAFEIVERQLNILVLRTQVLLSLSGIVITVTGFSGRAIADVSRLARDSIALGIFLVLASAATAIAGVLRLTWLTREIRGEPLETLIRGIELRDSKSRYLTAALALFVSGFSLYVLAIVQLILAARPAS